MEQPGGLTVVVTEFKFTGNTLLSSDQLSRAVAPFLNKELTFSQLKQSAEAVADAYRDLGWIVRAYLPKQEIGNGVVTIQVVEAVFGKAILTEPKTKRIAEAQIMAIVEAAQASGEPINSKKIDRILLLLDDLAGINVSGSMVQGASKGETDLSIQTQDEPWVTGSVSTDNNGSISTGTTKATGNFTLNGPLGVGDSLSTNLMKTHGSQYDRFAYSFPLGSNGTKFGVHYSFLDYNLVGSLATLNALGSAQSRGVDLTYPLVRSQLKNLNLGMTFDQKYFINAANQSVTSNYGLKVYTATVSGNVFDNLGGGGANSGSVGISKGLVTLDNSPNYTSDSQGAQTSGAYTKVSASLNRLQTINSNFSVYASGTIQKSSKNLDGSEKMYLGGSSGVRAYPTSEGGGSEGYTLTAEIREKLPQNLSLTGFYDYGWVEAYKNNYTAVVPNDFSMKGYGLSLEWQDTKGVDLKLTAAHRIGENPLATYAGGPDGDGSKKLTRIWLNATFSF